MTLTDTQRQEMHEAAKPLMAFLSANCHPHVTVILDSEHAELLEGVAIVRKSPHTDAPKL